MFKIRKVKIVHRPEDINLSIEDKIQRDFIKASHIFWKEIMFLKHHDQTYKQQEQHMNFSIQMWELISEFRPKKNYSNQLDIYRKCMIDLLYAYTNIRDGHISQTLIQRYCEINQT